MKLIDSIKDRVNHFEFCSKAFMPMKIIRILMTRRTLNLLISETASPFDKHDLTGVTKHFVFDIEIQIDESLFGTGKEEDHDFALVIQ